MKKKLRNLALAGALTLSGLGVQTALMVQPAHAGVVDTFTDSEGNIIALMDDGRVIKCGGSGCL